MLKFFTSDLRRNIIKIVCLSIGLSIGLLLLARVYFDKTYDSFFKDAERIYKLSESIVRDGEYSLHPSVSGGIPPLFEKEFPQIEVCTRFLIEEENISFTTEDGRKLRMESLCLADSNMFELFDINVAGGAAKTILSSRDQCVVPRSLAAKIGGDVIGVTFTLPHNDGRKYTISGIYEDFPLNSTIPNAVYAGLESNPNRAHGKDGLGGNDVYKGYIKIKPGSDITHLREEIGRLVKEILPEEFIESCGFNIVAEELTGVYVSSKEVRTMDWMLLLLATILILSSSLNFLLIVVSQITSRGKEMAVRKCFGTSDSGIFGRVMGESLFYLLVSLLIGILFVCCFPATCVRLLGYTPVQLFTIGNVWIVILGVTLLILLLTGVVPAWFYCRTPVSVAFRGSLRNSRGWKMALLAVQFFASGVLLCLLVLVARQHRMGMEAKKGYDDENVAWITIPGSKSQQRETFAEELRRLGFVKGVSTASTLIGEHGSGNMVWMNGDTGKEVNVCDNYSVNADFFDMMGIPFIEGATFSAQADSTLNQVVVERAFCEVVRKLTGEDVESIVGKSFQITEHGDEYYTICGVVEDIRRGGLDYVDSRAGVWFPSSRSLWNIYVKMDELTSEKINVIQNLLDGMFPDSEAEVKSLQRVNEAKMEPVRNFALAVLIAGIAILFIALIGLVGYTGDEVQRRAKEIAIRKVTGAGSGRIVTLFLRDVLYVALPSLLAGGGVALIAGRKWLSQFSEQVSLSPFSMLLCIVAILLLTSGVVVFNTLGVASSNPVDHLRNE